MMKKISAYLLIFTLIASPAFASSAWKQEGDSYGTRVGKKATFALTNVLFGWTEIFTEPYEAVKDKKNVAVGIGKGLWNGVGDTVGGLLTLVTFWCPKTDIPLPEGGLVPSCCQSKT